MFQCDGVPGLLFDRFSEGNHLLYPDQVGCNERHHRIAADQFHSDDTLVAFSIGGDKSE